MALELASRALNAQPVLGENGRVTLAGYRYSERDTKYPDFEFRGRRQRRSDVLVRRSARLRRAQRYRFFPSRVLRQGRHLRYPSRLGRSKNHIQAPGDRARRIARTALRTAAAAGGPWKIQAQHDCRRLYSCNRRPQSDGPGRDGRTGPPRRWRSSPSPLPRWPRSRRACWRRAPPSLAYLGMVVDLDRGATLAFHAIAGVAAQRAVSRRPRVDGRDRRLSPRRHRPGRAPAAQEFCALSGAAGDREDAVIQQAAGARRRNPRRHRVLFGPRRAFPRSPKK